MKLSLRLHLIFFLIFTKFLISYVFSAIICPLGIWSPFDPPMMVDVVCDTRYHVPFYLWWIRPVKNCKVPKYYDQDCRFFNLANDHLETFCHCWNMYFWNMWSYHISTRLHLNFDLMFLLLPERPHDNLNQSC